MYPRTTHSIGNGIGAADQHRAAIQLRGVGRELAGKILRGNHVVRHHVRQLFEPEQRELRQHASLIGNRRGQNDVESRKAVRRHDQQSVAEIVDVADLSAPVELKPRKICL